MTKTSRGAEVERTDVRPELFADLLHLFALGSFAIAQPILDLLARFPQFFVASRTSLVQLVMLALVLTLLLPAIMAVIELLLQVFSPRLRAVVHRGFVFLTVVALVLPVLKRLGNPSLGVTVALAPIAGLAFLIPYVRLRGFRTLVSLMVIGVVVFPAVFFGRASIRKAIAGSSAAYQEYHLAISADPPPVVMLVLDELNVTALLDEDYQIDRVRYPSFAALADEATWFRNTSAASEQTVHAVTAFLTGRRPENREALPTYEQFPNNLFTLLGGSYRFNVLETATRLCPPELNSNTTARSGRGVLSLLADIGVIYCHVVLPQDLCARLPAIGRGWNDFVTQGGGGGTTSERASLSQMAHRSLSQRLALLNDYIDSIEPADGPVLHYLHVLLPHAPFELMPSAKTYGQTPMPGLTRGVWGDDELLAAIGFQRYLLQVGATDTLIGRVVERLKCTGLYDRALIVVVSDHGSSFRTGSPHRSLTSANAADIVPIPLLVKLPGQTEGVVNDVNAEAVDLLPSIATVLGIRLPFAVDGHSLFEDSFPARDHKTFFHGEGGRVLHFDDRFEARFEAHARQMAMFGSGNSRPGGLFDVGPHRELSGTPWQPDDVQVSPLRVALDQRPYFDDLDLKSNFAPCNLTGRILAPDDDAAAERALAVAVNGTIRATSRSYLDDGGKERFSVMIPESALQTGANRVDLLHVQVDPQGLSLYQMLDTSSVDCSLREESDAGTTVVCAGTSYIPIADGLIGYVDRIDLERDRVAVAGWAFDRQHQRPVDSVVLFAGNDFIYAADLGRSRPDVAKAYGEPAMLSGFHFTLPRSALGSTRRSQLRVFARSAGGSAQLPVAHGEGW